MLSTIRATLEISGAESLVRELSAGAETLLRRWAPDRGLVAQGVLEQRVYSERPLRHEYLLTQQGWELADIVLAISAWGDRWTAGEAGPPVLRRHRTCGHLTQAELRCAHCGEPIHASEVDVEPGPGAKRAARSATDARSAPTSG